MNELALFAGAGGGLLAGQLLGWTTVCAVEFEPYPAGILRQRQLDGCLDPFPVWDDVRTFDGRPWRGTIDVVSGGFPCQDISSAGKRAGLSGERSGLWFEMLRIVGEVRPAWVFAENSPHLRTRGLDVVLEGLTRLGYHVAWGVLGASDVGAPHRRKRLWIVANADNEGQRVQPIDAEVGRAPTAAAHLVWQSFPDLAGVDDGVADRVDRIRATGNGQVPLVAATAFRVLSETLLEAK